MVSLSNHVAISLRLNTRRQTTIATATRLPRCARNDRLSGYGEVINLRRRYKRVNPQVAGGATSPQIRRGSSRSSGPRIKGIVHRITQ